MLSTPRVLAIRLVLILVTTMLPIPNQAQSTQTEIAVLHQKINKLSKMLSQLKSDQNHSRTIETTLNTPHREFSKLDSLRLVELRRKQAESRARIDVLTLEIIKLSKQLENPKKRYALAKKIQDPPHSSQCDKPESESDSTAISVKINARSIDLAAVKLIRQGKSLDQARLLTIDKFSVEQVITFYQNLPRPARYKLYDIADEIANTDGVDLTTARRSAIYFYLFTK